MSVPGLRSGSGHNPHPRMPAEGAPLDAHKVQYSPLEATVTKGPTKIRTRGRVMGTPGKVPADVYAQVIKGKQRAKRPAGLTHKQA